MEEGNKSNKWIMIVVVIALFAVAVQYLDEPRSQSTSELQYDESSMTFSRGERSEYPYPDWGDNYSGEYDDLDQTGDGVYMLEDYELAVYGEYADYGEYGANGYPIENACGYESYGYPDYIGTQKEGQTCDDAIQSENDLECLSSPPVNYDGEINVLERESSPRITCCVADGTCQWYR